MDTYSTAIDVQESLSKQSTTAKKAKKFQRKSPCADGNFLSNWWELVRSGDSRISAETLVGIVGTRHLSAPAGSESASKPRKNQRPPIYLPRIGKKVQPAPWRSICPQLRGIFYHLAMYRIAASKGCIVHAFTLRLTPDIEARARARGSRCLDWLHQRIGNHLRATLGHSIDFWFVLEEDKARRLHLHGELVVFGGGKLLTRTALKKAGGRWLRSSQYQLVWSPSPDLRGAGYMVKNIQKAGRGWRALMQRYGNPQRLTATFEGKALSATHPVKRVAATVYDEARTLVL
jgi:hypothetical protein